VDSNWIRLKVFLYLLIAVSLSISPVFAQLSSLTLKQALAQHRTIGLALGGGAAKGLAHIGVLKAFEEAGIKPDLVAGSSMGGLVGAAYVTGVPIDTLIVLAEKTDWRKMASLFRPSFARSGLTRGKAVTELLDSLYPIKRLEITLIPLALTAVDIRTGRLIVLQRGDLVKAVRATISIPIIFTPVLQSDTLLVDGGLVDPVPVDVVRKMGAEFVIAVNVLLPPADEARILPSTQLRSVPGNGQKRQNWSGFLGGWFKRWSHSESRNTQPPEPGLFKIAQNTFMIAQAHLAHLSLRLTPPDLLIEPNTRSIKSWEFNNGDLAIVVGYWAARRTLEAEGFKFSSPGMPYPERSIELETGE